MDIGPSVNFTANVQECRYPAGGCRSGCLRLACLTDNLLMVCFYSNIFLLYLFCVPIRVQKTLTRTASTCFRLTHLSSGRAVHQRMPLCRIPSRLGNRSGEVLFSSAWSRTTANVFSLEKHQFLRLGQNRPPQKPHRSERSSERRHC